MQRCSRCVTPASWPGLRFDGQGVCDLCRGYERRWGGWLSDPAVRAESARRLERIFATSRRKARGDFDALVPFTGGKDSTRVLDLLARVHGLRVLAYTYDNGLFTPEARANIDTLVKALGVFHEWERFDAQVDLVRHFLTKSGNFCGACVTPHLTGCYRVARRHGIPLIAFGLARRTDANLPDGMNPFHFLNVVKDGFGVDRIRPIWPGDPIRAYAIDSALGRVTVVNPPDFLPWDDDPAVDDVAARYGLTFPREHFDCLGSETAAWLARGRYGFSYPTIKASMLIRTGRMTREQGLAHVAEHEVDARPASAEAFAAHLGLTIDDLERCARLPYRQYYRGLGNWLAITARRAFFSR
jgi:hypothetical protein